MGLRPRPHWGSYSDLSDLQAGFKGPRFAAGKGKNGKKEKKMKDGKEREKER